MAGHAWCPCTFVVPPPLPSSTSTHIRQAQRIGIPCGDKTKKQFGHAVNTTCAIIAAMPVHIVLGTSKNTPPVNKKSYNIIWTMLGICTIMEKKAPSPSSPDARVKTLQNPNVAACHKISQSLYMPGRPDLSGCLNNLKLLFLFLHTSQQMALHLHLHAFTRSASP